jgi:hypothetical protein
MAINEPELAASVNHHQPQTEPLRVKVWLLDGLLRMELVIVAELASFDLACCCKLLFRHHHQCATRNVLD